MAYLLVWFKNPVGFSLFFIKSCELLTCYRKKYFVACVVTIFICSNNYNEIFFLITSPLFDALDNSHIFCEEFNKDTLISLSKRERALASVWI